MKRVVILLLDGVGAGELPDAGRFGDTGSNSLANTARAVGGLNLPNLQALGLGNIIALEGCPPLANASAAFGKMAEVSDGKGFHGQALGNRRPGDQARISRVPERIPARADCRGRE